jgi:hypothetical protein
LETRKSISDGQKNQEGCRSDEKGTYNQVTVEKENSHCISHVLNAGQTVCWLGEKVCFRSLIPVFIQFTSQTNLYVFISGLSQAGGADEDAYLIIEHNSDDSLANSQIEQDNFDNEEGELLPVL